MKLVLLGNGPFAVPLLNRIAASEHAISLVITRPERPSGKRREFVPGPVRARAETLGIPVEQPESVNSAEYVERLRSEGADVLVVADFGQILSGDCLSSARLGGINVHASLLPKYRGAAPVAWAVFHGETETGVSIIQMTSSLDAGGVILQAATPILEHETAGELEARLADLGAALALEALAKLESGEAQIVPQDASLATKAPRLKKEDGRIQWNRAARLVQAQVRAMQPWPGAFTEWRRGAADSVRLQIFDVQVVHPSGAADEPPGTVVKVDGEALHVAAGEGGVVAVRRLKPAGKREMDAKTFLNGYKVQAGNRFS